MPSESVAGINIKIGADLSDLKKQMGEVGSAIENGIEPGQQSVKTLADNTKKASNAAGTAKVNFMAIAGYVERIGTALISFTSDAVKDALKLNPDTAASWKGVSDAFDSVKLAFGEGVLSAIDDWLPKITGLLDTISKFAADNPETAALLMGIVGGIGALASVAVTAAPLLQVFGISLAGISFSALGVAGAIIGLVAILAILSTTLDEIGDKASETADEIAKMDTTTQHIVENGIGELSVEDRQIEFVPVWDEELGDFVETNAVWDENIIDPTTGARGYWVPIEQETVDAVNQTTEAITGMDDALTTASEGMTETTSAAEQMNQIYKDMQSSVSGLTDNLTTEGLGDAMDLAKDLVESEAFQQFTQQPISEEVGTSWEQFGTSVQNASAGFGSLTDTLSEGTAADQIASIGGEAEGAAAKFATMADAIYKAIDAILALNRVNVGGGAGGGKANIVVEPKAAGGPVAAGSTYIVGEQGPELFVPHVSGTIIPHEDIGSVSNSSVVVNFNGDVIGDERSIYGLVTRAAKAAIRQEVRAAA